MGKGTVSTGVVAGFVDFDLVAFALDACAFAFVPIAIGGEALAGGTGVAVACLVVGEVFFGVFAFAKGGGVFGDGDEGGDA